MMIEQAQEHRRKSPARIFLVLLCTPGLILAAWETGGEIPASRGPWICVLILLAVVGALAATLAERARERVLRSSLLRKIPADRKTASGYHIVTFLIPFAAVCLLPVPYAIVAFFVGYASVACFYMW
jgi:hypothetical protein